MAAWILFVLFLVVFVLSVLLVMVRRRPTAPWQIAAATSQGAPEAPPDSGDYHGVEIKFPENACCQSVKRLRGARLLPHQARLFPLPLPECDAAQCRCRYVHFEDRRTDDDRRVPFSTLTTAFGHFSTQERRSGEDRREGYVSQEVRIISDADFGSSAGDKVLASTSVRR